MYTRLWFCDRGHEHCFHIDWKLHDVMHGVHPTLASCQYERVYFMLSNRCWWRKWVLFSLLLKRVVPNGTTPRSALPGWHSAFRIGLSTPPWYDHHKQLHQCTITSNAYYPYNILLCNVTVRLTNHSSALPMQNIYTLFLRDCYTPNTPPSPILSL